MSDQRVHFHLAYIGGGNFQLTITHLEKPSRPIIEQMTLSQLHQSVRQMKPGSKSLRFAKTRIDCDNLPLDGLREYFKKVLTCHEEVIASGASPDHRIEEIRRNIDPTDGSGSWLN